MTIPTILSFLLLGACLVPAAYLSLLALAAVRRAPPLSRRAPSHRFIVAIPAHNEATVIENTVRTILSMAYPQSLFTVHVVADNCDDATAALARRAGALVQEREEGPRTGKGAALSWLFNRILNRECDAVVVFDADTNVDEAFLSVMDARLAEGSRVIQGQHVIANPEGGWFPALTWAMFLVDNRFQNLGRANLGWSAKHMGDSICFRADVLREVGWGDGLTEDYQLRQRLLLDGVRIAYEPSARGHGEAPRTWAQAQSQRARWLRGTRDSSQGLARSLLLEGIKRGDTAMLDGALQALLPSFSTLTLLSAVTVTTQVLVNWSFGPVFRDGAIISWTILLSILFVYPLFGLALERAPLKAYLAMLSGPVFVVWRTWLALRSRLGVRPVTWIRTAHRGQG